MIVEIPECRRCFCLPLRYGIIISGYIFLIISALMLVLELVTCTSVRCVPTLAFYKGVAFFIQWWLAYLLYGADFIFNIILLVGAHKKDLCLLTSYFYYGIITSLASFLLFFVVSYQDAHDHYDIHILEVSFVVCSLGIHLFQLLLVRSEMKKLKQRSGLRFVNHAAEVIIDLPIAEGNNPF